MRISALLYLDVMLNTARFCDYQQVMRLVL